MRNKREISLANCDFDFQDKNSLNTNEAKASSAYFSGRLQRVEQQKVKTISSDLKASIQTEKRQKVKTISSNLKGNIQLIKQASGITLIALVVTIVVLLILAGVSISTVLGNNGIIPRANEAKFKTELASIQEEFTLYVTDKTVENSDFSVGSLNASSELLTYNTQPDAEKGTGNISSVLKSSTAQKYIQSKSFSIIKGDLIYASQNAKELEWAQEIGFAINPYNIDENGVLLSSETNLMLMDEATGTLVIPEMVTAIGDGAFSNVKGLKKIIIPSNVTEIKNNAFRGNAEIEEVIIRTEGDNGVQRIGDSAFRDCTRLTSIHLPDTVKYIGYRSFRDCQNLSDIVLSKSLEIIESEVFVNDYKIKQIIIPEGVQSIYTRAFYGCKGLTKILIPSTLTFIGNGCFYEVSSIQELEISENNKNLKYTDGILTNLDGSKIFLITASAIKGTTFTVPQNVTAISDGMLNAYTAITKLIIHENVTDIDTTAFSTNVTEFEIDENNPKYMAKDGGIYSKDNTILYYYFGNNMEVKIPEGVTNVWSNAFRRNKTSLTLPNTLEKLDRLHVFYAVEFESVKLRRN